MDLRLIFGSLLVVFKLCVSVSDAVSNDTNTTIETTTEQNYSEDTDEEQKLFGNPFWLGFTVILFISLVVIAVFVSLTFGIYKYRQEALRRGHYKDRRRIYMEAEETPGPDYDMFTTDKNSAESPGVTNASYIGST